MTYFKLLIITYTVKVKWNLSIWTPVSQCYLTLIFIPIWVNSLFVALCNPTPLFRHKIPLPVHFRLAMFYCILTVQNCLLLILIVEEGSHVKWGRFILFQLYCTLPFIGILGDQTHNRKWKMRLMDLLDFSF